MKVRWTPRAVDDLQVIARHVSADDPRAARALAAKLKRRAESADRFPFRGRIMPEVGRKDVRELIVGNYRIVYRVRKEVVDILTIFEGHRLFAGL